MGYGAFMTVINQTSDAVYTNIIGQNCMYDDGDQGSWLSYFNNLTVQPGTTYPNTPNGVYIEANGGLGCALKVSTFEMMINNVQINFAESDDEYSCSTPPGITTSIDNSGSQAKITITIPA